MPRARGNPRTSQRLWALILAGGSGQRLWPLSRKDRPKQALRLGFRRSLLQATADRLRGIVPPSRRVVVTTQAQAALIRKQLPDLSRGHLLAEPACRNTAAAIGLGTAAILQEDPDPLILVLPADHVISDRGKFEQAVRRAARLAADREALVCFGIRPTYPATGYGYIEPAGTRLLPAGNRVRRFREKPSLAVAQKLVRDRRMMWNGGIFCWRGRTILEEIQRWLPRLHRGLQEICRLWGSPAGQRRIAALYRRLPSVSIDVGVMERSRNAWVVPAGFSWDDVGSWNSMPFLHEADGDGNVVLGPHVGAETRGSVLIGRPGHLLATVGVEDLVVVHTPDATLVCRKSDAQAVRRIVERLEATPRLRQWA